MFGRTRENVANTKLYLENAIVDVEKTFPRGAELSQRIKRLAELNALLDMVHYDNEIVDGEQDLIDVSKKEKTRNLKDKRLQGFLICVNN